MCALVASRRVLLGAANPLRRSLVSYWRLDEASGTRNDQFGTNHLTDNNSVGQATGKLNNAASFVRASNQFLSIADNASLSMTGSFTITLWAYASTLPGLMGILNKWNNTAALAEYCLYYGVTANRFNFFISDGSAAVQVDASTFGAWSTTTWTFIVAWLDTSAQTLNIQVNNGTVDSTACTRVVQDGANTFYLASDQGVNNRFNGRLDGVGLWRRVLTAAERTALWNNGAGLEVA